MKYLRVKDLIEELKKYDGELPVVISHEGKGHEYGITDSGICIIDAPYFGNDPDADTAFYGDDYDEDNPIDFLLIGSI